MVNTNKKTHSTFEELVLKLLNKLDRKIDVVKTDLKYDINLLKEETSSLKETMDRKFDIHLEHIDGLAGEFRKFNEELPLLSSRQADHDNRIEKLEEKVFATP